MADDAIGAVNKAETVVILVAIGAGIYLLYKFYSDIEDFINSLFGVQQGAGSYTNALTQTVQHPVSTAENILGIGPGYGSQSGGTVAGTSHIGASGQHYRCNDSGQCYPITIDANGNELVAGVPVPIDQAN
jgi:hypothetical protein